MRFCDLCYNKHASFILTLEVDTKVYQPSKTDLCDSCAKIVTETLGKLKKSINNPNKTD